MGSQFPQPLPGAVTLCIYRNCQERCTYYTSQGLFGGIRVRGWWAVRWRTAFILFCILFFENSTWYLVSLKQKSQYSLKKYAMKSLTKKWWWCRAFLNQHGGKTLSITGINHLLILDAFAAVHTVQGHRLGAVTLNSSCFL